MSPPLVWLAELGVFAVAAIVSFVISKFPPGPKTHQEDHCPNCGYDLRASSARCPECGEEILYLALI